MRGLAWAAAVAVGLASLAGCGDSAGGGQDGTCPDGVEYRGTYFRANAKDDSVKVAGTLGTGSKPGCTKGPDHDDYDVTVVRLDGHDPAQEVGVEDQPGMIYQAQP